jgi:hypothetical protein
VYQARNGKASSFDSNPRFHWWSYLVFSFNSGEQTFQTVQPRLLRLVFRIQNLAQVFNAVGNVPNGFGQNGLPT